MNDNNNDSPNGRDSQNESPPLVLTTTPYRPILNQITGDPLATILLQQLGYWWEKMGRKPFYKFMRPIKRAENDPMPPPYGYRHEDTLQVELGFTRRRLDRAMSKIAKRVRKGDSKTEALKTALVLYWVNPGNKTLFEINEPLIRQKLIEAYPDSELSALLMYETYTSNGVFEHLKGAFRTLVKSKTNISNGENVHPIESETTKDYEKTSSRLEGEGPPAPTSENNSFSALEIYQTTTKIKNTDKIPTAVIEWLEEQEQYMASDGHPEALRQAVVQLDREGEKQIFDVDSLDYCFSEACDEIPD